MINPKTILGEWVTALRSCPDLVTAIGGDGNNIRPFMEGLADHNNLRLAILADATRLDPGRVERNHAAASYGRCVALRASLLDLPARAGTELDRHVCRSVLAAGQCNTNGRSIVVIASAFPDRPRLLPDGPGSSVRAAKYGRGERGRRDARLLRSASNAGGARQSRRGMKETLWTGCLWNRPRAK